MTEYSTEAVACGLDDVAGWLENEGWIPKHVRQIRLGSKRLRELAPAMSPREGGDAVAAPGRSSASAVDGEAGQESPIRRLTEHLWRHDWPTMDVSGRSYATNDMVNALAKANVEVVNAGDLSRISEENAALRAERDALKQTAERMAAEIIAFDGANKNLRREIHRLLDQIAELAAALTPNRRDGGHGCVS